MPPKPHLKQQDRRYSWPPFKLSLPQRKKEIDDDPFSFFLSPPDGGVKSLALHLDADIQPASRPRSLSPKIIHNKNKLLQSPAVAKLRRWINRMETRYLHTKIPRVLADPTSLLTPPQSPPQVSSQKRPAPAEEEDDTPILDVFDVNVSPPLRGRRATRSSRRRYGDKMVRSHSKKARIWQEPNDDIWPVMEESEEIGLGIKV